MPDFKVKDLTRRLQLSKKIYEHNFAILIKLGAGSRERHAKKEINFFLRAFSALHSSIHTRLHKMTYQQIELKRSHSFNLLPQINR